MTTQALEQPKTFNLADWIETKPHYFLLALIAILGMVGMVWYYAAQPTTDGFGEALLDAGASWLNMTVAGLAMGLMIFIMASGMTLVFGLMHVLNLGHGAFITLGAYGGGLALLALYGDSSWGNLAMLLPALLAAIVLAGALGLVFERVIIKPVYDNPLKQILVTVGGSIIVIQLIIMWAGPNEIPLPRPEVLRGSLTYGNIQIEKYRLLAVVVGLLIFWGMLALINKTRVGLLIRAGVENLEMVESLGYRIKLLFISVFIVGSALAAVGGVMWGLYEEMLHVHMGDQRLVQVIIVIIIGGLGSITGCFYGALLVGLVANYVGLLFPFAAEFAAIGLMVAVLMWRPQGLIPVIKV